LRLLPGAFFQDHRRFNSTINGLDDSPIACSEARRKAQRGAADAIATGQSQSDFL